MLMCEVSKSVKETLQSTVGVVSTASFHALVCCDSAGHVIQQVPPGGVAGAGPGGLVQPVTPGDLVSGAGEMSTFKAATTSGAAIQRMSLPNRSVVAAAVT